MIDFLNNISYDTVFSALSVVFSTVVLFMLKTVSKKTENTFDDKIAEAFEVWVKKYKENLPKSKK
ncbi:MAG: hypothetical protein IKH36_02020 [Bacilli bacterium]|nr:hypothetical protein [Bacilli bacterium]